MFAPVMPTKPAPDLAIQLKQALLPALHTVLAAFPDRPEQQRALMPDQFREVKYPHGGICHYRSARATVGFVSMEQGLPRGVMVDLSTTHDIRDDPTRLRDNSLQNRFRITFSTRVVGPDQELRRMDGMSRLMLGMSLKRFFSEFATATGLVEGEPNIMHPGEFDAKYGEIYGDTAASQSLSFHNADLPKLRSCAAMVVNDATMGSGDRDHDYRDSAIEATCRWLESPASLSFSDL